MASIVLENDRARVYLDHRIDSLPIPPFDWLAFLNNWETSQTNRRQSSLAGLALNGHFDNSATSQPFRPLRSSKHPFSAVENLSPITV